MPSALSVVVSARARDPEEPDLGCQPMLWLHGICSSFTCTA